MDKNAWKILAIIFIVLFILETLLVIWLFNLGAESLEKEKDCAQIVCQDYDSYYYDDYGEVCYCYSGDEIKHSESLRNS